MHNTSKYAVLFAMVFFLLLLTISMSGCEDRGFQGFIYHDKDLIAKTSCEDELFFVINPDTIMVKSVYDVMGIYNNKEIYRYVNDGKYRIEKNKCVR